MLPDIQPVAVFQYDTKWVLKVVYIKHLLMVICFHPSSGVWPASPASCVVIYSQPASCVVIYFWMTKCYPVYVVITVIGIRAQEKCYVVKVDRHNLHDRLTVSINKHDVTIGHI